MASTGPRCEEITGRATVNQAAINYHFGGKEVIGRVTRDEAVRLFARQQVTPLLKHGQIGHYLRIFAWETLAPTSVWRDFIASEKLPILDQAEKIVRRFLPPTAARTEITIATIWLTQQAVETAAEPKDRQEFH
jgi:AcrR family transcriptional regulator